ncbi:MAG: carboxypeptidase regulatory-like domain-containing protein [Planctomycetota bacterium]|nr:MAG: carboxypeptidase regulatory-like domain-containing protein [Planctomycetota bacterium]
MRCQMRIVCFTFLTVVLIACGCDRQLSPTDPEAYTVEGRVTFDDGTPIPGVLVSFDMLEGTANKWDWTDDDGRYRIGNDEGEGLPLGEYRVVVAPPLEKPDNASYRAIHEQLDSRYANKKTSGLHMTIQPLPNHFDIELRRREVGAPSPAGSNRPSRLVR